MEAATAITDIEITLTLDDNERVKIQLDKEVKKAIVSVLLNFFKDGIPLEEEEKT